MSWVIYETWIWNQFLFYPKDTMCLTYLFFMIELYYFHKYEGFCPRHLFHFSFSFKPVLNIVWFLCFIFFQWICSYFVLSNFVLFLTFIFIAFQCKLFSLLSLLTKHLGVYITILARFYIWYGIFFNIANGEFLMFSLQSVPWLVFILLHFSMIYYFLNDFILFPPLTCYFTLLTLWILVQNIFILFTDMDKEKLQNSILIFF